MDSDAPLLAGLGQTTTVGQRLQAAAAVIQHAPIIMSGSNQFRRITFIQQSHIFTCFGPESRPLG